MIVSFVSTPANPAAIQVAFGFAAMWEASSASTDLRTMCTPVPSAKPFRHAAFGLNLHSCAANVRHDCSLKLSPANIGDRCQDQYCMHSRNVACSNGRGHVIHSLTTSTHKHNTAFEQNSNCRRPRAVAWNAMCRQL